MAINDLFAIKEEDNSEYRNNYTNEIRITSYTNLRNDNDWKKTLKICSEVLYQEINKKYPLQKIYFWVCFKFHKEPTRIELYKGIFNNKRLTFLSNKEISNKFSHCAVGEFGSSALLEVTDKELFSEALNYLRDSDEGGLILNSNITNFVELDEKIYSDYVDFSSLVNSLVNKDFVIIKPFGSFDDIEFGIEIYEKTFLPQIVICMGRG